MNKMTTTILIALASTLVILSLVTAAPVYDAQRGAQGANDTKDVATDDQVTAYGGNISTFDISVELGTSFWTGFFGSVTNSLVLEGTGDAGFFSWGSVASTGTIMFSNSTDVSWASIVEGLGADATKEDTELGLTGKTDAVASTLSDDNTADIVLGAATISAGTAEAINTSSNGGNEWETILLSDGANAIYATPIQQDNNNYAGNPVDYQIMVPVDGTLYTRTYYLYAALA